MTSLELQNITFNTIQTRILNGSGYSQNTEYHRVVGIDNSRGHVLWSYGRGNEPHKPEYYDSDAVEKMTFTLPSTITERVTTYFTKHLVPLPQDTDAYNCHTFAYDTMDRRQPVGICPNDDDAVNADIIPDSDSRLTRRLYLPARTISNEGLGVGVHGIVGILTNHNGILGQFRRRQVLARHSLIGLGAETNLSLQVMAWRGFLGLDTYQNILDEYRKGQPQPKIVNIYR